MSANAFARPVDERLWNDELLSEAYPQLVLARAEPVALRAVVLGRTAAPSVAALRDRVVAAARGESAFEHLFLLAAFASVVSEHAVLEVASVRLPDIAGAATEGRHHRLAVLIRLYEQDPGSLIDVNVLHQWNKASTEPYEWSVSREASFVGSVRPDWAALCGTALDEMDRDAFSKLLGVRFVTAIHRRPGDVVLAFRRPGPAKMRRLQNHRGGLTHDDTWLLIRIHAGGTHLDVAGRNPDAAAALATRIAVLLGADSSGSYRALSVEVQQADIDRLVTKLITKAETKVPLIELVWKESKGITHTVTGRPKETVEGSVGKARVAGLFEMHEGVVRSARFRFRDKYTIRLLFPAADEATCVTFVDGRLPKEVAREVVDHIWDVAKVPVYQSSRKRRRAAERRVQLPPHSAAEYRRLLMDTVDDVTEDEEVRLGEIEQLGIIDVTAVDWFACGDASAAFDEAPNRCLGEVEIWDRGDGEDRGASESEWTVQCPLCRRTWKPRALGVEVQRRAYTHVKPGKVWEHIEPVLAAEGFVREGKGVLRTNDGRRLILFLGVASHDWDDCRTSPALAVCRIRMDDAATGQDVGLADVLAAPSEAVRRAFHAQPPPVAGEGEVGWTPQPLDRISRTNGRIIVAGTDLSDLGDAARGWVTGLCRLAARAKVPDSREFATAPAAAEAARLSIAAGHCSGWSGKARADLQRCMRRVPFGDVFETASRKGWRIRPSIHVEGFEP